MEGMIIDAYIASGFLTGYRKLQQCTEASVFSYRVGGVPTVNQIITWAIRARYVPPVDSASAGIFASSVNSKNINKMMNKKQANIGYLAPEVEVVETKFSTVLCQSLSNAQDYDTGDNSDFNGSNWN